MSGKLNTILFILVLSVQVITELTGAEITYHTMSELFSALFYLLVLLNIFPVILFMKKKFILAILFSSLLWIALVPYQIYGLRKLILLKTESANITGYVYRYKINTGYYPENLDDYPFSYPHLKNNIHYKTTNDDFSLSYHVLLRSTSHFYSSDDPKWHYYPD